MITRYVCPDHPVVGRETWIEVEVHWLLRHSGDTHPEVSALEHPYPEDVLGRFTLLCRLCHGAGRVPLRRGPLAPGRGQA